MLTKLPHDLLWENTCKHTEAEPELTEHREDDW